MNNNLIKMIILIIGCIFLLSGCKEHSHTFNVLKVDPTCTEKGYINYNCKCGYQETQEIPALGHFYENGKCSCGELETIEIYVENKELTEKIEIKYGSKIKTEDYEIFKINDEFFDNWYLKEEVFDFDTVITSSITLTARFHETVIVTLKDYDDTILEVRQIIKGEDLIPSVTPVKKYYNFIGWDHSLNDINENITATAIYELSQTIFDIEYVVDDSLLYYQSKENLLYDFLVDFYEFVNPNLSFHAFCYGIEGSVPAWTNFIGGSFSNQNYLIYNNSIDEDHEHYFFNSSKYKDKWYKLSSYVKNNICKLNKRFGYEDVEYHFGALDFYRYMTNEPASYIDTYGGEKIFYGFPINEVNLVNQYEYGVADVNLFVPVSPHFAGWYKDLEFTDGPYFKIDKETIGDIKLYAKIITDNIYKIEFNTLTEEVINPLYVKNNEAFTLPIPVNENADFLGWYLDFERVDNNFSFNTDVCLVAKWDNPNVVENNYIVYNGKTITYRNSYVAVEIPDTYIEKESELRACWVSSFIKNFTPSVNKEKMIKELTYVLDFLEEYNMNCLIFHVRTHNNACYNTNLAPIPSEYGTIETFKEWDYLEWLIDECHQRKIEFHAWLNPYRIKLYGINYGATADVVSKEYIDYPLNPASNPDNILLTYYTSASGGAILNPAKSVVQDHIVNVCLEIAEKYNIDAIHFDDYFYQKLSNGSTILEEKDQSDYIKYINANPGAFNENSISDKEDWRRMNVDNLIMKIHLALTEFNKNNNRNVKFGISPTGTYKSGDGSIESGSNTTGGGHYNNYLYADTVKWINEEWIDYIMPQCYTSFNYNNYSFHEITTWWNKVLEGKKCNLYIGIGLYNSFSNGYSYSWKTEPDELINQLLFLNTLNNVKGVSLFSFSSMKTVYNNSNVISHNSFMILKNELWIHKVNIPFNE